MASSAPPAPAGPGTLTGARARPALRESHPGRAGSVSLILLLSKGTSVDILRIILQVLLVASSFFLILTILLHKGKGGGLSDVFGGGVSSVASSSGVAERNLNRITVSVAVVWVATIVGLGLLTRYA